MSNQPSPSSNPLKIVVVGGGSYNWSPTILCDLMHKAGPGACEVVLLDHNAEAAYEIQKAMERVSSDHGKDFRFTVAGSEEEAFPDADFVIITISTGGLEMMEHDVTIPDKYGIFQTVGDSVGPGGWSRLLRNIPVFTALAEKIQRLAPRAVVINYTNPMAGLTGALSEACSLRIVGLCHGLISTRHYLGRVFGTDMKNIQARIAGVNHLFWILDFAVEGRKGYELLRKKLDGGSLLKFDKASQDPMGFSDNNHVVFAELFEEFGHLTYAADRHTAEYFGRYLNDQREIERCKLVRTTMDERREILRTSREFANGLASGKESMPPPSAETAADIIRAVTTNTPFVDVVNLPNTGQIDNLPRGAVVETLGIVDANGFSPVAAGPLPRVLQQITQPHCEVQMMILEAGRAGDRKLAIEALALDPLCAHLPFSAVRSMGEELLAATAKYLPQF